MDSLGGANAGNLRLVLVVSADADALCTEFGEQAFSAHADAKHRPNVVLRDCHSIPHHGTWRVRLIRSLVSRRFPEMQVALHHVFEAEHPRSVPRLLFRPFENVVLVDALRLTTFHEDL